MRGASWVRENVLDQSSDRSLRLLVVWMPMLATDARDQIDYELLRGPRVRQFWDSERLVGTHLADIDLAGLGYAGIVWDAFFVFGPDARWAERPSGLVASGAPVVVETGKLEAALARYRR
jgi:hypothetical protein